MKEYREYYDSILRDSEYKLIEAKERQERELSLEIQHFHSDKDRGATANVWFFIVNGLIVAVADNWSENIEIFGEEW